MVHLPQFLVESFAKPFHGIFIQLRRIEQAQHDRFGRAIKDAIHELAEHPTRDLLKSDARFEAKRFALGRIELLELPLIDHPLHGRNYRRVCQRSAARIEKLANLPRR